MDKGRSSVNYCRGGPGVGALREGNWIDSQQGASREMFL